MNTLKGLLAIVMAASISGCAATSGAIPIGPDTYLLSHQGGGFWAMPSTLRVEALKEANSYCESKGKVFQVVGTNETPTGGFGQFPKGEVQFMCLDAGDPDLARPKLQEQPRYDQEPSNNTSCVTIPLNWGGSVTKCH